MRWLAATIGLISASAVLVGGIYLRDRDPGSWRPPESTRAQGAAQTVLAALSGYNCHQGCVVTSVTRRGQDQWLARLEIRSRARCFAIDLQRFSFTVQHGLVGVAAVKCV